MARAEYFLLLVEHDPMRDGMQDIRREF